jgi:hypothetical protein
MEETKNNLTTSISTAELERRWTGVCNNYIVT